LQEVLARLPKLYADAGIDLLDSNGLIKLPHTDRSVAWTHICKKAPDYFDVTTEGKYKKADQYGSFVLGTLVTLMPDAARLKVTRERVRSFSASVERLAQKLSVTQLSLRWTVSPDLPETRAPCHAQASDVVMPRDAARCRDVRSSRLSFL
jgi:hypothetical protein